MNAVVPPSRFNRREAVRRRRLRGLRRPIALAPTLMTLGNLIAGFAAIHYAAKPLAKTGIFEWSTLTVAGALIFIGMLFDALDGSVARLTRSTSDIGAQLDSLADLVTFGVAPAFMMLRLVSHYVGPDALGPLVMVESEVLAFGAELAPETLSPMPILGPEVDNLYARLVWAIAATYVCCTALRLARFNAETESAALEDHLSFRGLPSPGAGGAIASLIVLHQHLLFTRFASAGEHPLFERWTALGIPFITLLCAFAMVSSIRYVHIINRYLRGRHDFTSIVRIVVPVILAIWWFQQTLAVAFTAYALSGPIRSLFSRSRRRRGGESRTAGPQSDATAERTGRHPDA